MSSRRLLAALCGVACCVATSASAGTVCTLLVDASTGRQLAREGAQCETRNSPASTFKIAIAVLGFDAGILSGPHAPAWPYKPEYQAWKDSWKTTVDPTSWLWDSVVWYSREITRRLGPDRFQRGVDRLDYGNRDLSGDPGKHNGLSSAWLSSSLQISPAEQVAFLRKLLSRQLPVSRAALDQTIAIMPRYPLANGWTVYGKTGTGYQKGADGKIDHDRQFGWFVGWAQKGERRIVFARLVKDDSKREDNAGPRTRDEVLADLPGLLPNR
jgi:beta-lactamase class D